MANKLLSEIRLLWRNRRWLPSLMVKVPQDAMAYKSELNPANTVSLVLMDYAELNLLPSFMAPARKFVPNPFSVGRYPPEQDTEWYFVNGISTTPAIAVLNAEYLSELFQRPISILYNPTNGLLADLVECAQDRTFDRRTAIADGVYTHIVSRLYAGKRVRLIGHSQGGIIAASVANRLLNISSDVADRLEIFTFGGACDQLRSAKPDVPMPYNEHFANWRDFVAQIGVIDCKKKISGTVYTHDAEGHLLNAHYLQHFREGRYCNGKSRLYNLISHTMGGVNGGNVGELYP